MLTPNFTCLAPTFHQLAPLKQMREGKYLPWNKNISTYVPRSISIQYILTLK